MRETQTTVAPVKPAALEAHELTRRFGHTVALDELSFSVDAGQIIGLLGRNGAGKSTLLRIISGQLKAHGGDAALFGETVTANTAAFSQLCLIGDTPDFGKLPTIKQLFYVCKGLFPKWDAAYAMQLVERFDLPLRKQLKGFSRGMQTSLLLCVGLASGAPLTIFDEPSLGLDAVMRERFYDLLLDAHQKDGERTFILSTHLIDEVARTLDAAVLIDAGKLLYQGKVADLMAFYMSVSGAPDMVREVTQGQEVLREEDTAGSLVRHIRLASATDRKRIEADERVQSAPMNLQRLFVFLTEEKEADRNAADD